jgi:hypothetical protein
MEEEALQAILSTIGKDIGDLRNNLNIESKRIMKLQARVNELELLSPN